MLHIATDDMARGTALARDIGPVCDVSVCLLEQLAPPAPAARILVCDFDLAGDDAVRLARERLGPYRAVELVLIFVVTQGSFHQEAQAHALGAHLVVPRHRAAAALPEAIDRILGRSVSQAVDIAYEALTGAFAAAAAGRALSRQRIEDSSGALLSAVEGAGVFHWLDQSRSINEQTAQHCLLVAGFCAGFAVHLGLSRLDRTELTHAAMLHDLGKAKIPQAILDKPGRLTGREMAVIRQHPILGWDLLTAQRYGDGRLLDAVLHHHELLDGSGYPDGLRAGKIPDFVRIITLCDIFGALLEHRPYKAPLTPDAALAIMAGMGAKLDADLMRVFRDFVHARVVPATDFLRARMLEDAAAVFH